MKRACRVFGKPEDRAWETLTMVGLEKAYSRPIRGLDPKARSDVPPVDGDMRRLIQ